MFDPLEGVNRSNLRWQKSTRSNNWDANDPTCFELAPLPDGVHFAVRNSRDPDGPVVTGTKLELAAFLAGARDGEFDHLVA